MAGSSATRAVARAHRVLSKWPVTSLVANRDEPVHAGEQLGPVGTAPLDVALEQVDGVVDHVLDVGGVAHGQSGQLLDGDALADQGPGRGQHLDVVGAETLAFGAVARGRQQAGVDHQVNHEGGHAGPLGQAGPVEHQAGLIGFGRGDAVGHAPPCYESGPEASPSPADPGRPAADMPTETYHQPDNRIRPPRGRHADRAGAACLRDGGRRHVADSGAATTDAAGSSQACETADADTSRTPVPRQRMPPVPSQACETADADTSRTRLRQRMPPVLLRLARRRTPARRGLGCDNGCRRFFSGLARRRTPARRGLRCRDNGCRRFFSGLRDGGRQHVADSGAATTDVAGSSQACETADAGTSRTRLRR